MIHDFGKASDALVPLILEQMGPYNSNQVSAARERAAAIIDFSWQLIYEETASIHMADRFAAALITNARDRIGKFSLDGVSDSLIKKSITIFNKQREQGWDTDSAESESRRRSHKIVRLLHDMPSPKPIAGTVHSQGTINPAPVRRHGKP